MWTRPYGHNSSCRCCRRFRLFSDEMNKNLIWIFVLITQCVYVASRPANGAPNTQDTGQGLYHPNSYKTSAPDEQVISVRITSSVAVGRGKGKTLHRINDNDDYKTNHFSNKSTTAIPYPPASDDTNTQNQDLPPNLLGANIEFIKQLKAKKEPKENAFHELRRYQLSDYQDNANEHETKDNDESINEKTNEYSKENVSQDSNESSPEKVTDQSEDTDVLYHSSSILDDALKLSEDRLTYKNSGDQQTKIDDSRSEIPEYISMPDYTDDKEESNEFLRDNEFNVRNKQKGTNETDDSIAEPSIKSVLEIVNKDNENYENIENVPLARSVLQSPSSKNYIQGFTNKPPSEREPSARLTTVSFNVVHDPPKLPNTYSGSSNTYINPHETFSEQQKFYEPQKTYSQPAQIYSEPAKYYSEPAKIYSEPAKVYSEPAKIYSEPAKIYSEPAKFYSEPASLHLNPDGSPNYMSWQTPSSLSTTITTTPISTLSVSTNPHRVPPEHQAEKNYEVDEKVSVLTDGRSHGVQESTTEKCKQDNCKVGYVVKGREYNKYRVEERTSDGFIVGEYGVVRNEDGALRGVRYTADGDASPRLIYDALMKFLQLK